MLFTSNKMSKLGEQFNRFYRETRVESRESCGAAFWIVKLLSSSERLQTPCKISTIHFLCFLALDLVVLLLIQMSLFRSID